MTGRGGTKGGGELNKSLLDAAATNGDGPGFMVWVNKGEGGNRKSLGEVQASLSAGGIRLGTSLLLADDIAGLQDVGDMSLMVHSFPQQRVSCFGGRERAPERHELVFSGATGAAEKARWLAEWRKLWGREQLTRVLVIVNPAGGRKKAVSIWSDVVAPMFQCAGVEVEYVETARQRHAQEFVAGADLSAVDGIVCVSGDGLLIEVVNGLLMRRDAERVCKIPLGIIPAGTGNGLCMSVLARNGDKCTVISAALAILRGRVDSLDVANVEQDGEVKYHSIISLEWGLPSDTDIMADSMRWCGSVRFTIQGLLCIAKNRVYEGCIRILPPTSELPNEEETHTRPTTRSQAAAAAEREVDQRWIILEGKFAMVWACNITHCVSDNFTAPKAHLNDGCLDVLVIRDGTPRSALLKMFLDMEKGLHVDYECLEYYKAREIVWEPRTDEGLLAVDGELVACGTNSQESLPASWKQVDLPMEYASCHVKVQQGLLRVFS